MPPAHTDSRPVGTGRPNAPSRPISHHDELPVLAVGAGGRLEYEFDTAQHDGVVDRVGQQLAHRPLGEHHPLEGHLQTRLDRGSERSPSGPWSKRVQCSVIARTYARVHPSVDEHRAPFTRGRLGRARRRPIDLCRRHDPRRAPSGSRDRRSVPRRRLGPHCVEGRHVHATIGLGAASWGPQRGAPQLQPSRHRSGQLFAPPVCDSLTRTEWPLRSAHEAARTGAVPKQLAQCRRGCAARRGGRRGCGGLTTPAGHRLGEGGRTHRPDVPTPAGSARCAR